MQRQLAVAAIFGVTIGWTGTAIAGPCADNVAKFEQTARQSGKNPVAGPTSAQTVGAQLSRQPTQESVKQASDAAWVQFNALLARARSLDAAGDQPGCTQSLTDAQKMFEAK
jgi:hypothetical protein